MSDLNSRTELLQQIINEQRNLSRPDREKLAGALLMTAELRELCEEEQQTAFDIAPLAAFTAIYHRSDFEKALRYAEFALQLAEDLPDANPVRILQAYRTAAQALRALKRDPLPLLRSGIRYAARLRKLDNSQLPQTVKREDIIKNSNRLLFGAALAAIDSKEWLRADRILSAMQHHLPDKDRQLHCKLFGLLKLQQGEEAAGISLLTAALDNSRERDRHTIDILFILNSLDSPAANQFAAQLAGRLEQIDTAKLNPALCLKHSALQLQLALNGIPEKIAQQLDQFIQTMNRLQLRFTSPEGVEGYLGRFEPLLEQTVNRCYELNDSRTAFHAAASSFWTFTLPDSNSALDPAKLPDRLSGFGEVELTHLLQNNFSETAGLLFYSAGEQLYRFHWNKPSNQPAVFRLNCNGEELDEYIEGLHSFFFNPGGNGSLLRYLTQTLAKKLLEGLPDPLRRAEHLTVWSNERFNMLPWHALFPGKTVVLQPGCLPARERSGQAENPLLAVIENGATLPATLEEKRVLLDLFDNLSLIIPGEESNDKQSVLQQLSRHKVFHFGGHGYRDNNNPAASGLLLHGDPRFPVPEQLIQLREIQQLQLDGIKLVFLNNCSSADGLRRSGELYSSTAAAFLRAGAENLIVTLAPLRDDTALQFMRDYYSALAEEPETAPVELFNRIYRAFLDREILLPHIFITRNSDNSRQH